MTIADLRLSSTAPQRRHRSVCRRRWPSFATLPTDCYKGVNAAVPYCGCILIPLLPVGWSVGRSVGNKGCLALGGSLQKDNIASVSIYHTPCQQRDVLPSITGAWLLSRLRGCPRPVVLCNGDPIALSPTTTGATKITTTRRTMPGGMDSSDGLHIWLPSSSIAWRCT